MLLMWICICIVHHPPHVPQLIPGGCNDVAPVVAEQRATEGEMIDYKVSLERDGRDIIQEGLHVGDSKQSFDRGIDTATGGFLLLVEDAQEGLEEVGWIFDLRRLGRLPRSRLSGFDGYSAGSGRTRLFLLFFL